jgi:hypothetical protein
MIRWWLRSGGVDGLDYRGQDLVDPLAADSDFWGQGDAVSQDG